MKYFYRIYGLCINSEVELPEAYETKERSAQVMIRLGKMPEFIQKKEKKFDGVSILTKDYKWIYCKGAGDFLVENGNRITVEPESNAVWLWIRVILLGACLGGILQQRETLALHGSAVVWRDKAVIISGDPGAGKTTIATALIKQGALFSADDTVAMSSKDGVFYASPAYPQQKLCRDTALSNGYDIRELILIQEERDKYAVKRRDIFCPCDREAAMLVCLECSEVEHFIVEEIIGSQKLEYIIKNLFTYYDYQRLGMSTEVFRKCLELAKKLPVIRMVRPRDRDYSALIVESVIHSLETRKNEKEYILWNVK